MRFHFELLGFEFGFIASARKKRHNVIGGITNRTKDGMYVMFLDYDGMHKTWVIDELKAIQSEYGLSEIYVFTSKSDSFHAVCFDKITREEYENILYRSSCDPNYKKVPWTWGRRVNTLRITKKNGRGIKFIVRIVPSECLDREKSQAHAQFFQQRYGIDAPDGMYDHHTELILADYLI